MTEDRLSQIVEFCKLIDKEKFVQRRTYLSDGERLENDAEHAWHMAVMAILLSDYSNEKVDVLKVVSLLLVHDLVEIYAGDTFAYDEEGQKTQRERELAAAELVHQTLGEALLHGESVVLGSLVLPVIIDIQFVGRSVISLVLVQRNVLGLGILQ